MAISKVYIMTKSKRHGLSAYHDKRGRFLVRLFRLHGTPGVLGLLLLTAFVLFLAASQAIASGNENEEGSINTSGLPLPRFASLRTNQVNMRTGPGTRYPIEWVFIRQGVPVEITAEYEIWRRVRDNEGAEGWVHKNELSGKRMALVTGTEHELRGGQDENSAIVAHLESGAIGQLISCTNDWCKLKFGDVKGFLRKTEFWGAYINEIFD